MSKAGLKLMITDLAVTRFALAAFTTAADKWNGYSVAGFKLINVLSDIFYYSSKLVTRYVRQSVYIWIGA